jgi:asparagine synthase (glutamine-hydrolysing)
MCGVLGIVSAHSAPERHESCQTALAALRHRGPDAQGQYQDANVWLGHTRLSILDLSAAGSQPMQSADRRFIIVYNGEVYNFRELAARYELENLRSGSDTEVVLRLFAKSGVNCLRELNGMFALAMYDRQARKLWLARDRVGIKPLYYKSDDDGFIFASEIKGIIALDEGATSCDLTALHEWLYFGNTLGGQTLYRGIKQLLPGQYLELDLETLKPTVHNYWSLERQADSAESPLIATRFAIEHTRDLLQQAVRRQLVSDVPVGVFLSGGVDSSAITAFASRDYGGRLATYSAGFDCERGGGELPKARRVAAYFGTEHHEVHVVGGIVGELIEKMVRHHDMPFSDPANIPLYLMSSKISTQTKVVLQGDGGDELFGGYRRYSTLKYYRLLHALAGAADGLQRLIPKCAAYSRAQRYVHAFAAGDIATTMALLLTPEDRACAPEAIFGPEIRQEVEKADPFARHRECHEMFRAKDIGNQMSFMDLMITLPDLYLEKVDRSTMAASMEVRVPFLDNELVDFIVQLPGRRKFPWGRKKWLLKAALRDIVPAEVLQGPKVGFDVPFAQWLRGELRAFFLDHLATFERRSPGVLDGDHVRRMLVQSSSDRGKQSYLLWKTLNLMVWGNSSQVSLTKA